jgi:4a-hydroxytetrahydrobiopterin dehydratase
MDDEVDPKTKLTYEQARDAGLADWRWLLGGLHARFETGDFVTGLALANAIGQAAEEANHHPDLDLRYPFLAVKLVSHDVGGVTDRDLQLARRISELAASAGVAADPTKVKVLELALDTADIRAVLPFWEAVLGFKPNGDAPEVIDPDGRITTLWFQRSEPQDGPPPPQRFHLDLVVPIEQAQARIDAALAAGGTLVTDEYAPAFWVLADADGNKACVCTPEGRSA